MKTKGLNRIGFLGITVMVTLLLIVITAPLLLAQPPGLPSNPSPAPIDGGLLLLAAGGGAYAIKKLRDKDK